MSHNKNRTLEKNIFYLFILYFSNYVFPLLVIPIAMSELGMNGWGKVAGYIAFFQLVNLLGELGFSLSITSKIAINKINYKYVSMLNGGVLFIKLCIIPLPVALSLFIFQDEGFLVILFSSLLISLGYLLFPTWFFNGIEKMKHITKYTIISKTMYCVMAISYLYLSENPESGMMIFIFSFTTFFGTFLALREIYKEGYIIEFPAREFIVKEFGSSLQYFYSKISSSLYTSLSPIVLLAFATPNANALYSVVEQAYKAGKGISGPMIQALYPYIVRSKNIETYVKILSFFSLIMAFGCTAVAYYSNEILQTFFDINDLESSRSLKVIAATVFISFLGMAFGYPVFSYLDRSDLANFSTHLGLLSYCIMCLFVYKYSQFSVESISYCLVVAEITVLIVRISMIINLRTKQGIKYSR